MSPVRIQTAPAGGGTMTRPEVEDFLSKTKLLLRLATVNPEGDPEIQPTWYYYEDERLYLMTEATARKVQNIKRRNRVYFSVDTEISPYKGVKGRGVATIVPDRGRAVQVVEAIIKKYFGGANEPMGKMFIDATRNGTEIVIQITPDFYSVWDYGKPTR